LTIPAGHTTPDIGELISFRKIKSVQTPDEQVVSPLTVKLSAEESAMPDSYPKILRTAQVAEILGLKPATVRKAAREGQLPAYRLPDTRTYFYFEGEILEWMRSDETRVKPK
jgi:excisionase family DNA binding protein